jgi:uncharacterized protein
MSLDLKILDVIACPICKGKLQYDKNAQVLICKFNKIAFPVKDGVPIMLVHQAKPIRQDDRKSQ